MFSKKVAILVFLAVFSCILSAIILYYRNTEVFVRITSIICNKSTIKEKQECFQEKILHRTQEKPELTKEIFDTIWNLAKEGKVANDMRLFSPILHEAGMLFVEDAFSLNHGIQLCTLAFRGGCIHGVIMEFIDNKYTGISPRKMMQECNALANENGESVSILKNCVHALGHEFAAKSVRDLNSTLFLCEYMPTLYRDDCLYGVLMEYSKGAVRNGRHSENPVGKHDPNCLLIDNKFKNVCYLSLGFYRQYEAESESWEKTYRFCEQTPNKYKEDCVLGVGGALLFSYAMVIEKAQTVCGSLPEDIKGSCQKSILIQ